jgi:hypothetical protein
MIQSKTAFVTFFPIKPDTMGSSAVVNSRFINWPTSKKLFQISHVKKINNKKIQTIFIKKETPLNKIFSLPEMTIKIFQYLKKSDKKNLVLEGASWIFYSFFIIFFLKIFLPKINIIYISHGIESDIRKKYSNILIFTITKFIERLVFKFADLATSVSSKDKIKIKKLYGEDTRLLPNGISLEKFIKKKKIKNDYIIYTGSYLYKPNRDSIDFLNKDIMPKLIKIFPNIKLVLTGGGYKKKFPWLINKDIVTKKELYNLIFFSKCMSVPLMFGYGTRIKIIEALSIGAVVISTKKGIEGIKLNNKNPPFIISDMNLFIKKIIEVIQNNKKLKKKSIIEKNYYLKEYSMKNILNKFINENKIK